MFGRKKKKTKDNVIIRKMWTNEEETVAKLSNKNVIKYNNDINIARKHMTMHGKISGLNRFKLLNKVRKEYLHVVQLRNRDRNSKAYKILKRILKQVPDYAPAQYQFGLFLKSKSRKRKQLFDSAFSYYSKTTENSSAERQLNLAGYYYFGNKGIDIDKEMAEKWYLLSAENGNSNAQHMLFMLYHDKYRERALKQEFLDEQTKNYLDKSMYWLHKSADNNNMYGLYYLGLKYMGDGKDKKQAEYGLNYIRKSKKLGCHAAKLFLIEQTPAHRKRDLTPIAEWFMC